MTAIKAHFDGKVLVPEEPVDLPLNRTLIVHVETEATPPAGKVPLRPLIFPKNPEAARKLIEDPEAGLENF
jgi:hypothetical protein